MSLRRSAVPAASEAPNAPAVPPIDRLFSEIDIGSRLKKLVQKAQQSLKPSGIVKQNQKQPGQTITYRSLPALGDGDDGDDGDGNDTFGTSDVAMLRRLIGQPFDDVHALLEIIDVDGAGPEKAAAFEAAAPNWRQGTPEATTFASHVRATLLEVLPDLAVHGVLMQGDLQSMLACVADPVSAAIRMRAREIANDAGYTEKAEEIDRLIGTTDANTQRYIYQSVDELVPYFRGLDVMEVATGLSFRKAVDAALLCDAKDFPMSGPDDVRANAAGFAMARASYPLDNPLGVVDAAAALPLKSKRKTCPGPGPDPLLLPDSKRAALSEAEIGARCAFGGGLGVAKTNVEIAVLASHGAEGRQVDTYDAFCVPPKDRSSLSTLFHIIGELLLKDSASNEKVKKLVELTVPWKVSDKRGVTRKSINFLQYVRCQMRTDETPTQALVKSFAVAYRKYKDAPSRRPPSDRADAAVKLINAMVDERGTAEQRRVFQQPVEASDPNITSEEVKDNGNRIAVMIEYVTAIVECASNGKLFKINAKSQLWKACYERAHGEGSGSYLYNPQGFDLITPGGALDQTLKDPPDVVLRLEEAFLRANAKDPTLEGKRDRLRIAEWDDLVAIGGSYPVAEFELARSQARAHLAAYGGGRDPTDDEIRKQLLRVNPEAVEALARIKATMMGAGFEKAARKVAGGFPAALANASKLLASLPPAASLAVSFAFPVVATEAWYAIQCAGSYFTGDGGYNKCIAQKRTEQRVYMLLGVGGGVFDAITGILWRPLVAAANPTTWPGRLVSIAAVVGATTVITRYGKRLVRDEWEKINAIWADEAIRKKLLGEIKRQKKKGRWRDAKIWIDDLEKAIREGNKQNS